MTTSKGQWSEIPVGSVLRLTRDWESPSGQVLKQGTEIIKQGYSVGYLGGGMHLDPSDIEGDQTGLFERIK